MQVTKEIIDEPQTVTPDPRQPMTHRILVTFNVPRDGANGCTFSELSNAIAESWFERSYPCIGSSSARRDPMTTFKTEQATRTTMPTGKLKTGTISC
ncbi:hypothetical protein ANRL3_02757 [Anaerolineae bacterium]|nr:hypothetical protein ANRL3_02757 [Anaerolineae bacterium]